MQTIQQKFEGSASTHHSVKMSESYTNMQLLLKLLNYEHHSWLICGDLKVISLLLGQKSGYTRYPCFLCLWDSRADKHHYLQQHWPARTHLGRGSHNIISNALVKPHKVLLPPSESKISKFFKSGFSNLKF